MANFDPSEPGAPAALPEPPGAPWVTMLTTLLILFVFGGLLIFLWDYASGVGNSPNPATGEQQLQELRAQERDILDNYGYMPPAKAGEKGVWRIPINKAMDTLAAEGKDTGELQLFPQPKAKK